MDSAFKADGHTTQLTGLRVLVVDDNRDAADSLALLLSFWGHEVQVTYDGASAFQVACSCRPSVMLLDIGLPKLDGHQLARQLRQEPSLKGAILIAVTGYADEAHRLQWEEAFDYYLVKPVEADDLQKLLETIQRVIHRPEPHNPSDTLKARDTLKFGRDRPERPGEETVPVAPSPF